MICTDGLIKKDKVMQVLEHIEFRDMLPKSKVGKPLRRELRAGERKRFDKSE